MINVSVYGNVYDYSATGVVYGNVYDYTAASVTVVRSRLVAYGASAKRLAVVNSNGYRIPALGASGKRLIANGES